MNYIDSVRTQITTHVEFLLIQLIATLLMMTLVWIEIRHAIRRAAMTVTEVVATTTAACVPEIAAAAQNARPGVSALASSSDLVGAVRTLGHLSMGRTHWPHAIANPRLLKTALPPAIPDIPVYPLIYNTPRPLAGAHLATEHCFAGHVHVLQAERRVLQVLETTKCEGSSELHRVERKTSAIVKCFDQTNAQPEQINVQHFLIQKFSTLDNRRRELTTQLAALHQQLGERTEALWARSQRTVDDCIAILDPPVAVARRESDHGTVADEMALWLIHARTSQGPLCVAWSLPRHGGTLSVTVACSRLR